MIDLLLLLVLLLLLLFLLAGTLYLSAPIYAHTHSNALCSLRCCASARSTLLIFFVKFNFHIKIFAEDLIFFTNRPSLQINKSISHRWAASHGTSLKALVNVIPPTQDFRDLSRDTTNRYARVL